MADERSTILFLTALIALLKLCDEVEPNIKSMDLIKLVKEIGKCAEQSMGGTMGARELYDERQTVHPH